MWPSGDLMDQYVYCGDIFGLQSLITGLHTRSRPYKHYASLSASRFIRTLIKDGTWEVAKEVLIYQRHRDAHGIITDITELQKHLDAPFKMQWDDAKKLCEWEDFFKDCMRISKQEKFKEVPIALKAVLPLPTNAPPNLRIFFESWLLAYRFGYDSVPAFSSRDPLTSQQLADFHFHARMMVASRFFRNHVCWPRWSTIFQTLYPDLLLLWAHGLPNCYWLKRKWVMDGGNPMLRHKIFFHLAVAVEKEDWEGGQVIGWMGLKKNWDRDVANASVSELVSKYENSCDLG